MDGYVALEGGIRWIQGWVDGRREGWRDGDGGMVGGMTDLVTG